MLMVLGKEIGESGGSGKALRPILVKEKTCEIVGVRTLHFRLLYET